MGSYETLTTLWHKTLTYSNIFDYPLTEEEIYRYMLTQHPIPHNTFSKWLDKNRYRLQNQYTVHDGYWMLQGRTPTVLTRKERNIASKVRLAYAKRFTFLFYLLPWVKLIGVTGAVAAQNASKNDDIDLLIITAPNRQWFTRAVVLTVFTMFKRRYRLGRKNKNQSFCLNHIMTTDELEIPTKDAYIANDIARTFVLWDRGNTYRSLLQKNHWIGHHLANWWEKQFTDLKLDQQPRQKTIHAPVGIWHLWFVLTAPLRTPAVVATWILDGLERVAHHKQQNKNSKNKLTQHIRDNRNWILREYHLALQQKG